jgi:hypothetical protein
MLRKNTSTKKKYLEQQFKANIPCRAGSGQDLGQRLFVPFRGFTGFEQSSATCLFLELRNAVQRHVYNSRGC